MRQSTNKAEASTEDEAPKRSYNILVFGVEKVGLTPPAAPIKRANYTLNFELYTTARRFNDFDGVILFQGIFEKVDYGSNWASDPYIEMKSDKGQLDKRQKEMMLLFEKRGIACFLLRTRFVDEATYGADARSSDLTKVMLNISDLYRKNFDNRTPSVDAKRNEFIRFLKLHGAASSFFENYTKGYSFKPIATTGSRVVGFSLADRAFFVPSLVPENRPEVVEEFFDLLADALTATANKLAVELPEWIDAFRFSDERVAITRKGELEAEIEDAKKKIAVFQQFKRVLVAGDQPLAVAVADMLRVGFGYAIDQTDEHREDLKVLDAEGKPVVFVEVKGINANAKLEHVNQADSHRERAGLPTTFPTVLVLNTYIKNARDLKEKDKPIGKEQIERAVKSRVLIVRTLDLIALLELMKKGSVTPAEVLALFRTGSGWLQVWGLEGPLVVEG